MSPEPRISWGCRAKVAKMTDKEDSSEESEDIEIVVDAKPDNMELVKTNQVQAGTTAIPRIDQIKQGVDIEIVGKIDGKELYEIDLDSFEDKPWRKPGADITDYFNFGFNENTWRRYCNKQKAMREELAMQKKMMEGRDYQHEFMDFPMGFGQMPMMASGKYQRMPMFSSDMNPRFMDDDDQDMSFGGHAPSLMDRFGPYGGPPPPRDRANPPPPRRATRSPPPRRERGPSPRSRDISADRRSDADSRQDDSYRRDDERRNRRGQRDRGGRRRDDDSGRKRHYDR